MESWMKEEPREEHLDAKQPRIIHTLRQKVAHSNYKKCHGIIKMTSNNTYKEVF